jgi:hypothetical protein
MIFIRRSVLCLVLGLGAIWAKQVPSPVNFGADGNLVYALTERGDRVPDFSGAGYAGGGVAWPHVPVRVAVGPVSGDAERWVQAAIDYVASLPADARGFRGAVQIAAGRYTIAGQLKIRASGVVLRGAGSGPTGTVLVAAGTGRRALIELGGTDSRKNAGVQFTVADSYVPVGATTLSLVQLDHGLSPGMSITLERPSPGEWIQAVGMDVAPGRQPYTWKPGAFNVRWDRVVAAVDGRKITLDAPLTVALESRYGGATVQAYIQSGYIQNAGIENLRCESAFDAANVVDEDHAWNAIDLHAAKDVWVADVTAVHFASSVVQVGAKVARVTVQDCVSLAPVAERGGYRRMAFHTRGQQTLFLRCTAEQGGNDFTVGYLAAGPNVFLECAARETQGFSGSIGSWASGVLYDGAQIDGGSLRLDNLETWNQGVGWAAANAMLWNSSASVVIVRQPPGAHNWAVGVWGQFLGDGAWSQVNEFAKPVSLYRAQLQERCGQAALSVLAPRRYSIDETAPRIESVQPHLSLAQSPKAPGSAVRTLALVDGWLTVGGSPLQGKQSETAWWLGRLEPSRAGDFGAAITRFAPGRTGTGLTDEIAAVATAMERNGQVAFRHHYGLWYDRRRIDHQLIRRPDGDVYPPFYEQPFTRSGQGKAWDGLSRYDLTKYNPWYFSRLREFATEAHARGLVLVNEMYFQHNLIESAAHWMDSPWRSANNINATDFVEPPPVTGDTIKMADAFYDITHPIRRELHRSYIRHCLSNLSDEPNVIHTLSAENSGPLSFMQFWIDVIAEWERETGLHPLISLSAPKDVQDAILADPTRAATIDVIDLTYWWRTERGDEFAPRGGLSLAPRQHERLWKGGKPTAASIARMAREYREKFPGKAVTSGLPEAGDFQPR